MSVIPNHGLPARKPVSPVAIGLGICGGCGLIAVLALFVMGIVGGSRFQRIIAGRVQQQKQSLLFLKAIKAHDYVAAESLMSPEGRLALPEDQIKKLCEDTEQKLGPLQSWLIRPSSSSSSDESTDNRVSFINQRSYHVVYQKGKATITFGFTSNDRSKLSRMIGSFDISTDD